MRSPPRLLSALLDSGRDLLDLLPADTTLHLRRGRESRALRSPLCIEMAVRAPPVIAGAVALSQPLGENGDLLLTGAV